MNVPSRTTVSLLLLLCTIFAAPAPTLAQQSLNKRYLYVATPGICDYVGYGGHGILVFDINNNHRFVKRIPTKGLHPNGSPSDVKGVAVSVPLNSIFVSTIEGLQRIDPGSLDGKYAYPSSGEVIDVKTRKLLTTLQHEHYNNVSSEKMVEVHFSGNKLITAGDQFGVGRVK